MADDQTKPNSFDMNRPTIICLLYLGGFLTGISALIGLIVAYIWKGEPHDEWMASHFAFHIRSFWIGVVWTVIAVIGMIVTLGLLAWVLFPLVSIWFLVRTIKALVAAQHERPIPNPETWLV